MQSELVIAIAAIVAVALLVVALVWWRRRVARDRSRLPVAETAVEVVPAAVNVRAATVKPDERPRSAAERGARRTALAAIEAIETPSGRERGLQLAAIARRYLADAYAIPALSCTTSELYEQLRRNDVPADDWRGVIDSLDAVRFGGPTAIRDLETNLRAILTRDD